MRRPLDLPWRGQSVRLILTVRRFRCINPECERYTFAEDCGPNLPRYARRTLEASKHLLLLVLIAGGEAGARLAANAGLPASADTLLRLLRAAPLPAVTDLRALGIDDFAMRKRQVYGTIFVDMETHRPVDMVEGREANTVANWLRAHPGVEVIARDRSGAYAEGAREGAPRAVQVADRFHLIQNTSEALDGMLRGRRLSIEEPVAADPIPEVPTPLPSPTEVDPSGSSRRLSPTKQFKAGRQAARIARWKMVKELAQAGTSIRQIAREVGICRITVRRLLASPQPPSNQIEHPRPRGLSSPTLQPYVGYLQDRWQAGCTNVSQLCREIAAQGYPGSRSLLAQAVKSWRPERLPTDQRRRVRRMTRRLSMRWLCLRPPGQLKPEEKALLERLLGQDPELTLGHGLLQQFRKLVAGRDVESLDVWLAEAKASNLPTFVALANGIYADRAAVDAGLTLPWSNGPTEGQINRLKLISPKASRLWRQAPRLRPGQVRPAAGPSTRCITRRFWEPRHRN